MLSRRVRCAYCRVKRAVHTDHLISRNQARSRKLWREREDVRFKVPACFRCNIRRLTMRLVPVGYAHRSALEAVTGQTYREWDGGKL